MNFDEAQGSYPAQWMQAAADSIGLELYADALTGLKAGDAKNAKEKAYCQILLSEAHSGMYDFKQAKACAEKALAEVVKSPDKKLEGLAMHALAKVKAAMCDWAGAIDLSDEVLSLYQGQNFKLGEAATMLTKAKAQSGKDLKQDAVKTAKQALEMLKESKNTRGEAAALALLAEVHASTKKYEDALRVANEMLGLYEGGQDVECEGRALLLVARVRLQMGEYEDAKDMAQKAAESYHLAGHQRGKARGCATLAEACLAAEDTDACWQYMQESLELSRDSQWTEGEAQIINQLAVAHMSLGNHEEGTYIAMEGVDLCRKSGYQKQLGNILCSVATANMNRLFSGAATEQLLNWKARVAGKEALDIFRALGYKQGIVMALNVLAYAFLEHGNYLEAKSKAKEAVELCQQMGDKVGEGMNLLLIAQTRFADNKEEAVRLAKLAEKIIKESGNAEMSKEAAEIVDSFRDEDTSKGKGAAKPSLDVQSEKTDYTLDMEFCKTRMIFFDGFIARALRTRA